MTHRQRQAIALLLENSEEQTARQLGLRLSTLHRWLGSPEFAAQLQAAQNLRKKAIARLSSAALQNAVLTLRENKDAKIALEVTKLAKNFEHKEEDDNIISNLLESLEDD